MRGTDGALKLPPPIRPPLAAKLSWGADRDKEATKNVIAYKVFKRANELLQAHNDFAKELSTDANTEIAIKIAARQMEILYNATKANCS